MGKFDTVITKGVLMRATSTLALGVLMATASGTALAQVAEAPGAPSGAQALPDDQDGAAGSEIVVTGIRASLAKSLDAKRNADSIVDVISAEDIGKFPDDNVAETLQRVPGVSIDRQAGEGRFVSVNGLGPEFVSVLVNGRVMANDNPDRSFSFDTLAPELVSSVKVYKSANAAIPEGGIGGTIDVVTARPFDYDGLKASIQIGGLYEENSEKAAPQASFLISDRFMDGRLGVLASFNYFKRRNRTYAAQNTAMIHNLFFDFGAYAYVADSDEDAFRMQELQRSIEDQERERTSGTLAVQYKPTDNLLFTVDYLHSRLTATTKSNSVDNWFWAVLDTDRNVKNEDGVYTTFDHSVGYNASGFAYIAAERYRPVTTNALGFNAQWEASDQLTATLDLSGSRTINDNRGRDRDYTVEALNHPGFLVVTPEGGTPYFDGPDIFVPSMDDTGSLRARITSDSGAYVKSENWQAKLDFVYQPLDRVSFNFGGSFASQRKQNEFWQTPEAVRRFYHGNATNLPIDPDTAIIDIIRPGNVFGSDRLNSDMFVIDGEALRAWMADPANIAARRNPTAGLDEFIANGRSWKAVKSGDSYVITERVSSAYVDAHLALDLLDRPLDVVAGMRFTHTDLTSDGTTRVLIDLVSDEKAGILAPVYASDDLQAVSVKHRYSNWLPSMNMTYHLASNVLLRLGFSKTLTRPILENLAPAIHYGALFEVNRYATASNPELRPFTSFNIDASAEYYFGKASGIAVSWFRKRIDDYIVSAVATETIDTVQTPAYQSFQITRPRNADTASIDGFTFQAQHTFDFGVGFIANYTLVNGKVRSDDPAIGNSDLPGLSDTANLTAFYENDFMALRLAYNWRDRFKAANSYGGITGEPRNYRAYHQLDGRISFSLPHGIGLALDVVNITGETVRSYGRDESAFISYQDYGRRYTLTATKKF